MVIFQLLLNGVLVGTIYAIIASGLTLILGVMKVLNLAHCEFMMLSMYFTYFLYVIFEIDPFLSLLITMPLLFIVGIPVYRTIVSHMIKTSPMTHLLVTLGLMIFLQNLVALLLTSDYRSLTGYRAVAFSIHGLRATNVQLISSIIAISAICILYALLIKTRWGQAVRACSQDLETATLMGVNASQINLTAFSLGIMLAGVAGSIIAATYYIFPTVGLHYILVAIVAVVLGGMGSIFGALISSLILGIAESLVTYYVGAAVKELAIFITFILILMLRPRGLFGREVHA